MKWGALACVFFASVFAMPGQARVQGITITQRETLPEAVPTGHFGPYERLEGIVRFAFAPDAPANAPVVDLALAPRNGAGEVEARANFVILQPADAARRRGIAWLEVSNRGGMAGLRYFHKAGRGAAEPYGDGLLFRQGLSLIWVGWQYDVPAGEGRMWFDAPIARLRDGGAITGLARSDWVVDADATLLNLGHRSLPTIYQAVDFSHPDHRLTRRQGRDAVREEVARASWRFSADGKAILGDFKAGYIYELVYRTEDPRVVGLGLAAARDFASFAKYDAASPFKVDQAIAFGVSQTGRFLRHFLYQGFNVDEAGRPVFDGMLIHTAGAGRGSFNHRFAQPSRDAHRYSAFFYPTDLFPFSTYPQPDPLTGKARGLLDALPEAAIPKIVATNTGYEYWGRAAALIHSDWRTGADVPLHPRERVYHLAGGQHYVGRMPVRLDGSETGNPLDFLTVLRALAVRLVAWVGEGSAPPPSRYPQRADKTLVPASSLAYPAWLGIARPPQPHSAYVADYGPRWDAGIIDRQPPVLRREIMPLVPAIDPSGNELGGIRLPALSVPAASFIPWSMRKNRANPLELNDFEGFVVALPADLQRPDRARFLAASRTAAQDLIDQGLLLAEDMGDVLHEQATLWDKVMAEDAP
ncbi:MAG: alpha/beta hydrolase domain-containing protein [Pseudomonadota bacterium]